MRNYNNYTTSCEYKHDEGRNLLIAKSEILYPLKFDRHHFVLSKKNRKRRTTNSINNYVYNSTPLSIERNYPKTENIRKKFTENYNYFTPIYNERYKNDFKNRLVLILLL